MIEKTARQLVVKMPHFPKQTEYSDKYYDDVYEYRHVSLSMPDYHRLPQSYREFYDPQNIKRINEARQKAQSVDAAVGVNGGLTY